MKTLKKYLNYFTLNINTILKYTLNSKKYILIDGFPHTKNFGDALNTPIVEYLSEKEVLPSKNISRFLFIIFGFKNYAVIGSVLQWIKQGSEIWGAGYIDNNQKFIVPGKIHAVRGPKTREIYIEKGFECPEVYGDPALLLPLIYYPKIEKKYKYGIIPHYFDFNHEWINKMRKRDDVIIIDLMVYTNYQLIVDQILSCEKILSSSLHGVIVSDVYKIPNIHISISDKVIGSHFKFEDYYQSVNKSNQPMVNPINTNLDNLEFSSQEIQIDLHSLINACPFILKSKRESLLFQLKTNEEFSHLNKTF